MTKLNPSKFTLYFSSGFIIFFIGLLSPALSTFNYDKDEIIKLQSILQSKSQASILELEKKLAENGFNCKKFANAYSGGTVIKIQGLSPYVLKIQDAIVEYLHEFPTAKIAGENALSPKVLFSGGGQVNRYMVMEFLQSELLSKFMEFQEASPLAELKAGFNINWDIMGPVLHTVRHLHDTKANFPSTTTIYEFIWDHFALITKYSVPVPKEYKKLEGSFNKLMHTLAHPKHYKPCHFDLHGYNIFFNEDTKDVKLIDWGYAGIGNIYLELAAISLNFRLLESEDKKMLKTYFGRFPSLIEEGYFFIAKTLCLGVYSVREFIRPYFEEFPPFPPITTEDLSVIKSSPVLPAIKQCRYDDIITCKRFGAPIVGYHSDLELGMLMLHEYNQRLESNKMRNVLDLLRKEFIFCNAKGIYGFMILTNDSFYDSYIRNFLLNYPLIRARYYSHVITQIQKAREL